MKIADFGLAKLASAAPENFTLTGTHQVMGTPRYMAPEQMEGSHLVDHRADIYSLGVVFYEMLTGELPLGRFEPPSRKASIDTRVDDVVHRALAKEPARRYQRASELRRDVESVALAGLSASGDAASRMSLADGTAGFPGPSTILEQKVAGVVNWFREGGPAPGAPPPSATDRASVQRKVRGPAIALMLFGVLLLFPAVLLLTNGFDVADGNDSPPWFVGVVMMVAGLGGIGLSGLILRGGWHMLSLEGLRPALLAGILGQPIGLWALIVLSRRDVKAAFATGGSAAVSPTGGTQRPAPRAGRDWVTLTREQVESDALPDVCMVCGQPARERTNKTFDYSPDWAAWLLMAGFIPGVLALMLTSKSMRVACPLCPQHRGHWSRLTWLAAAGWLLILLLGAVGYLVSFAVSVPHRDGSNVHIAGLVIGAIVGVVLWLVPVVYLATTRVSVKRISDDAITLENVAPSFTKAAGRVHDPPHAAR